MDSVTPDRVVAALKARGWMLATAESCTGGLISAAITQIAGSSAVFDRGFVTYSNDAKIQMLGVPADVIAAQGAVSEPVALHMATGARMHSNAQISVSVTGIAGPGGSDFKPEGRVCFGLSTIQGISHAETVEFGAIGRDQVRAQTVSRALALIVKICEQDVPD